MFSILLKNLWALFFISDTVACGVNIGPNRGALIAIFIVTIEYSESGAMRTARLSNHVAFFSSENAFSLAALAFKILAWAAFGSFRTRFSGSFTIVVAASSLPFLSILRACF